ncbi:hypothetical protein [Methylobacterium planeticum]|uniref:Calcium-binding protein n=1 Tax=Methylobacterium planeticum TaxID=2615211 RepID=A0A6N6MF88_9HYPH|nr:hypothetical protein [Methylobacterium planeticum]KAB1068009.1 hypothetical protein F6X51_27315 [Methylobacterium planeticum]
MVKYAAGDSFAGVTAGANNFDSITAFATGTDKIDLSSFGFTGASVASVRTNATTGVNATTGEVAAAQASNFFGAGGDQRAVATVTTAGGDTFVYVDANKDGSFQAGTDLAVKLVATAAPALADFTFTA